MASGQPGVTGVTVAQAVVAVTDREAVPPLRPSTAACRARAQRLRLRSAGQRGTAEVGR